MDILILPEHTVLTQNMGEDNQSSEIVNPDSIEIQVRYAIDGEGVYRHKQISIHDLVKEAGYL